MNYAEKFKLEFIVSDSPERSRKRIVQSKDSEFIDENERTGDISSDISFLLKELYLLGKIDETFHEVPLLYPAVTEYLTGNWQKNLLFDGKCDTRKWHGFVNWLDNFRNLLMWCSASADWKSTTELLQFMDQEVSIEKCSVEGQEYYIALRHHFTGNEQERDLLLKEVIGSRNKKYRQLAETFQAILGRDTNLAIKNWNTVFKLWLQQDATMDWYLAPEATFLYYFALENGISIPLQEDQKDHIINFDQQKGKF